MYQLLDQRVSFLQSNTSHDIFSANRIGLEKESLRVGQNGGIANTPHPKSLGSALTHPCITTDYSEALLEFVTPPLSGHEALMKHLVECQTFVYSKIEDELLWATSMPCVLAGESSIPLARYGTSNLGKMKTVYRRGLGLRYGRVMQVIAGVHFNFSFSDEFWKYYQAAEKNDQEKQTFISDAYFQMIRNFQRYGWLIPYLFGASPAVCKSFLNGQQTDMEAFDDTTLYYPYATSLRMGDIGYQNSKEDKSGIRVSYDNLARYIQSLHHAVSTPYEPYKNLGLKDDDRYLQLNANLLQIENEYYSTVRPKQPGTVVEMPVSALRDRGVEYVELRSLDVNAYEPTGISEDTLYFLEAFVLFCQLNPSDKFSESEQKEITKNTQDVAHHGRKPGLKLMNRGKSVLLKEWADSIFGRMQGICELLDRSHEGSPFQAALKRYQERVEDPDATPSARMLREMRENKEGFYHFSLRKSQEHDQYFRGLKLPDERLQYFEKLTQLSLEDQANIEREDVLNFDDFLLNYFNQTLGQQIPYSGKA